MMLRSVNTVAWVFSADEIIQTSGKMQLAAMVMRMRCAPTDAAIVFPSGYHARTGLLEALLSERDWVFCDEMIHPGLADGVRLSRARVYAAPRNRSARSC